MSAIKNTALWKYLHKKKPEYSERILMLYQKATDWLKHIVETFPEYTDHSIEHSERIIQQLSLMLFKNNGKTPVVKFTAMEVYLLMAAAILHDFGMVVTDSEKKEILKSQEWQDFVNDEKRKEKWNRIEKINIEKVEPLDLWASMLELRLLLAEYVRAIHHKRSSLQLELHKDQLGEFDLGSPEVLTIISNICAAHGLDHYSLKDNERFPELVTPLDEHVNVRFLAILLRVGDLLDLSIRRAGPLSLDAVQPLPKGSRPHWQQYREIKSHCIDNKYITFSCQCETQETHALLYNWFSWLEDELENATLVMTHAERHHEWKAPVCQIRGDNPTIKIEKAKNATYEFHQWKFELDHDQIVDRLVHDIAVERFGYLRELLQNALDATRCQMYLDFPEKYPDQEPPEYPTKFPEEFLRQYPVLVQLTEKEVINKNSGEKELKQILTIEDHGIGMDDEVISRYFLQVGRSYYQSPDFRREFRFAPISRFGVGFLSVFSVSDHVVVETFKPTSKNQQKSPMRLTLRGPKEYFITDQWTDISDNFRHGTRIVITLRQNLPVDAGLIIEYLRKICVRVEVPVQVKEFGNKQHIRRTEADDFLSDVPSVRHGGHYLIKAFKFEKRGLEGEVYIRAYKDRKGEYWLPSYYPRIFNYDILENVPKIPDGFVSIHGLIAVEHESAFSEARVGGGRCGSWIVDLRHAGAGRGLSRQFGYLGRDVREELDRTLSPELRSMVEGHLDTAKQIKTPNGWKYVRILLQTFAEDEKWAVERPQTTRVFRDGSCSFVSWGEIDNCAVVTVFFSANSNESRDRVLSTKVQRFCSKNSPILLASDYTGDHWFNNLILRAQPKKVWEIEKTCVAVEFKSMTKEKPFFYDQRSHNYFWACSIPDESVVGCWLGRFGFADIFMVNTTNPFGRWLVNSVAHLSNNDVATSKNFEKELFSAIAYSSISEKADLRALGTLLYDWSHISKLPRKLKPPSLKIEKKTFSFGALRPRY